MQRYFKVTVDLCKQCAILTSTSPMYEANTMKNLDTKLKELRLEAGLSQQELARRSGISVAFISKLESGTYSSLGLDKCHQLSVGLGLTLRDFLEGIGLLEDTSTPKTVESLMYALRKEKNLTRQQVKQAIEFVDFMSMQNQKQ